MKVERVPNLSPGGGVPGVATDPNRVAQTAASHQQRHERGRATRRVVPRTSHAAWTPAQDRPDPVDLLEAQARDRLPDLLPIRYARMMASPFACNGGLHREQRTAYICAFCKPVQRLATTDRTLVMSSSAVRVRSSASVPCPLRGAA